MSLFSTTALLPRAEVLAVDILADQATLLGTCVLVETEVNTAIYACVVDVIRDLPEAGVVEVYVRYSRTPQIDRLAPASVDALENLACRIAQGGVCRRIARKTRRDDEWRKRGVAVSFWIAV